MPRIAWLGVNTLPRIAWLGVNTLPRIAWLGVRNKKMDWYVYIVECSDSSLYTGISNDVEKRVWKHNNKLGAVSVKGKLPVKLVFKEFCGTKSMAAKRESEIKGWNRLKKLKLIGPVAQW